MHIEGELAKLFIAETKEHIGHNIEIVEYGDFEGKGETWNISIECADCCVVIMDADTEDDKKNT